MSDKKLEQLRDICLTILALMGVLGLLWTVATKDIQVRINENSKDINILKQSELNTIKWKDVAELNDQLKGMNKNN